MLILHEQDCDKHYRDSSVLDAAKADSLLKQIPGWRIEHHQEIDKLVREFDFIDFRCAVDFTRKLATLAEEQQHHPAILTEWGRVTVYWWTHKVKGLHLNDFIMAAKTDNIAASTD